MLAFLLSWINYDKVKYYKKYITAGKKA